MRLRLVVHTEHTGNDLYHGAHFYIASAHCDQHRDYRADIDGYRIVCAYRHANANVYINVGPHHRAL